MPPTCDRYSSRVVNRPAKPRCQPSIIASANAHAQAVAQLPSVSVRHERRCATECPHTTAATATRMAGAVPQPAWTSQSPKIGEAPACVPNRSRPMSSRGLTPQFIRGNTTAAATRTAPAARPTTPGAQPSRSTSLLIGLIAVPANRRTNALRSTLPMPRRGSASTTCSSRGAAVASSVRATCARSASSVGAAQPSRTTIAATTRWPSRSSARPNTAQSPTAGWVHSAASTGCGSTVNPPVLIASSARPSTVSTPASSTAPRSSVRNQPGSANGSGSTGLR